MLLNVCQYTVMRGIAGFFCIADLLLLPFTVKDGACQTRSTSGLCPTSRPYFLCIAALHSSPRTVGTYWNFVCTPHLATFAGITCDQTAAILLKTCGIAEFRNGLHRALDFEELSIAQIVYVVQAWS
jgi:hypothetical protein